MADGLRTRDLCADPTGGQVVMTDKVKSSLSLCRCACSHVIAFVRYPQKEAWQKELRRSRNAYLPVELTILASGRHSVFWKHQLCHLHHFDQMAYTFHHVFSAQHYALQCRHRRCIYIASIRSRRAAAKMRDERGSECTALLRSSTHWR